MNTDDMTVEQRLERLESLLSKVLAMADQHPMGKMFLKMLGL